MAKKIKIRREELKEDEVADSISHLIRDFQENRVKILGTLGILILVFVGTFAYRTYRFNINEETSRILHAAHLIFRDLPNLQNEDERKQRLDDTIADLQQLIDRYEGSQGARQALYLQGNCYFYMDELDEAQRSYRQFIDLARTDEQRARGEIAMGYALENQFFLQQIDEVMPERAQQALIDKLNQALDHYVTASSLAPQDSYLHYYALMNQARLLELTSHDAEALEIYRRIQKERKKPRETTVASTDDDLSSIRGFLIKNIQSRLEPLSINNTARLRAERIEAISKVVIPDAPAKPASAPEEQTSQTPPKVESSDK